MVAFIQLSTIGVSQLTGETDREMARQSGSSDTFKISENEKNVLRSKGSGLAAVLTMPSRQ